jgi:membrane peptidoglycan carboxypeptidase
MVRLMRFKKMVVVILLGLAVAAGGLGYAVFGDLPSVDGLEARLGEPSVRITDRNGRALYDVLPEDGGRHAVVGLENIPLCMKQASIAVEDRNFYQNAGVDPEGVLRALWINRGGETISGGSTITQQVARSLLLQDEMAQRTCAASCGVLAWQLARRYSKDEILGLYLNQTFYGGFAYGVRRGADVFYKPASELLLPECALLAGATGQVI